MENRNVRLNPRVFEGYPRPKRVKSSFSNHDQPKTGSARTPFKREDSRKRNKKARQSRKINRRK